MRFRVLKEFFRSASSMQPSFSADETLSQHRYESSNNTQVLEKIYEYYARQMPESNGSSYYKKAPLKVGVITDDFMYNYYRDALDLIYLTPDNFQEILDNQQLDFILYVTCWYGKEPTRDYRMGQAEPTSEGKKRGCACKSIEDAQNILNAARSLNIMTVFQTIEDPTNYTVFLEIARYADVVFTTAVESVDDYIRDLGHQDVYCLPYGVNPLLHNPIGFLRRRSFDSDVFSQSVFFAGSWYSCFPERCTAMEMLFDGVLESGMNLVVADRNLLSPAHERETLQFPAKYSEFLIPPIDHILLQRVHKLFDFSVNINTVTDSKTMCAMRAYEISSLGSLIFSNATPAMEGLSPSIFSISSKEDIKELLGSMTEREKAALQLGGIRKMLSSSTVYDRLNYMFEKIGQTYRFAEKKVDALTVENRNLLSSVEYEKGEAAVSPAPEFFMLGNNDGNVRATLFVEDALNAFKFCDVDYVALAREENKGYEFVSNLSLKSIKCRPVLFNAERVSKKMVLGDRAEPELKGFLIS